ncbi:hypothetical protein P3S68_030258 [Capsicum galapagoense]
MEPINELVLHVPVFPIMVTLPLLSVKSYCPSHFLLQLIFCKMTGYNKLNINGAFDGLHNLVMRVTYPETPQQPGFLDMLTTLPHFNSTSRTTCTVTWSELSFSQLIATDSQVLLRLLHTTTAKDSSIISDCINLLDKLSDPVLSHIYRKAMAWLLANYDKIMAIERLLVSRPF